MNYCVWAFIFCECEYKCDRYLSANCEEGYKIIEEYDKEVNEVVEPIRKKYQERFKGVKE